MRTALLIMPFMTAFSISSIWAQDLPVLKVYTYSSFAGEYGPGKAIETAFEAQCACDLVFVGLEDTGALLARLKLEGDSTSADVVLGLDSTQMSAAKPFMADHGQAMTGLTLPQSWSHAQFMPLDWGHIALIYDSTKLAAPPTSLKALVDDARGVRLIVQDPRTSAPGFGFLSWIDAVYGKDAGAAWTKLSPSIVTYTKGWSEAYELFLKGEADMVVSYTTSPAYHIAVENKTNYKAAILSEGHPLQIEVMGLTRASKQPELARRFLGFMLSEAVQKLLPEGNYMFPAKLAREHWPASFKALELPAKAIAIDPDDIAARRETLINDWLDASVK
jgi:thiamine transport system substrate-binding protein